MKLISSGEPRDASQVAFSITLIAFLVAIAAFFAGAILALMLPGAKELTQPQWQVRLFTLSSILWLIGMVFVLRHYRRATRHWVGERRGGGALAIVECIIAAWAYFAPQIHPQDSAAQISGLRIFLDVFLCLSMVSHVATYAMLGYRPHLREIGSWTLSAVVAATEIHRLW